jgi:hypothetical protein
MISTNNDRLASLWRTRRAGGGGVAYLGATVVLMLLVGLFSPTTVPVTLIAAIFVCRSVIAWMAKNAGLIEELRSFVGTHWPSLTFTEAIGEKAIYRSSDGWRHKCDFSRVTAVQCAEDEKRPYVAYREDQKTSAMLQRTSVFQGDGITETARRPADIVEAKARPARRRRQRVCARRGTQISI